ncbi:MAG: glycosyltransferase [Coriobacteriales bacterium]|nr:glycosyltransferase [Coriobacteriales bacterium]
MEYVEEAQNKKQITNSKLVSIIIPCYCSEKYLASTVNEILKAFAQNPGYTYRIILINDGSQDNTFDVIRNLCKINEHIIGIDLNHNYGQSYAKMLGIPFISGDYAVFMDDDGQHNPCAIFSLINENDKGYCLVYAQFPQIKERGWRRAASKINDWILRFITKKPPAITITSFFSLNRDAIYYLKELDWYAGSVGLTLFPYTKKVTGIPVEHQQRAEGESRYTLRKLFLEWHRFLKGSKKTFPAHTQSIREIINGDLS